MCRPGENYGVGLRRQHRLPVWFSWMKAESISIWPDGMAGEKGAAGGRSRAAEYTKIRGHVVLDSSGWNHGVYDVSGGTTADKFLNDLKEALISTLRPGDIVGMDHLRTHHVWAVGELLRDAGAEALYLSAYSLDLNPIENFGLR